MGTRPQEPVCCAERGLCPPSDGAVSLMEGRKRSTLRGKVALLLLGGCDPLEVPQLLCASFLICKRTK